MSEQLSTQPPYAQRLFDYFLGRPEDSAKRQAYIERGLLPTNNLHLFIVDDPQAEMIPNSGIANPYDWRTKSFGHLIQQLKTDRPELWEQAKQTAAANTAAIKSYWDVASTEGIHSEAAEVVAAESEKARWASAAAYTQIIEILGPQLDTLNIDPVTLCA